MGIYPSSSSALKYSGWIASEEMDNTFSTYESHMDSNRTLERIEHLPGFTVVSIYLGEEQSNPYSILCVHG